MDDEQIDYFLDVLDGICAKFGTFDSGLPTHRPEGMQALRSAMRIFLATANASPAIVGTPSKEGAGQVEAELNNDGVAHWLGDGSPRGESRVGIPCREAGSIPAAITPPASPSEGGGEPLTDAQIDEIAESDECYDKPSISGPQILNLHKFARAVLSLSPSRGEAVDAAKELLRAVELEMSPEWECNSYHPAIAPAVERLKAAIQSQGRAK